MVKAENVLYRFYNADRRLLYVGITSDPENRFRGHRADKPWWGDVAAITLTRYADRRELAQAEIQAIESEQPKYNATYALQPETLNVTRTRNGRRGAHRIWNDPSRFHTSYEDTPTQFKAPKLSKTLPCPICCGQRVYKDAVEYGQPADELVRCPSRIQRAMLTMAWDVSTLRRGELCPDLARGGPPDYTSPSRAVPPVLGRNNWPPQPHSPALSRGNGSPQC